MTSTLPSAAAHPTTAGGSSDGAATATLPRPSSRQGRVAYGKSLRKLVARSTHGPWEPAADRTDPIDILRYSNEACVPHLLPIRYGRMLESPLAFFRGAAAVMASDLAMTPSTGIRVQVCGDCHLVNFAGFATPDHNVAFDISDFDETLPAPWEWDLKRLATSVLIAGRQNGLGRKSSRQAAQASVRAYREQMLTLAGQRELDIWYERMDAEKLIEQTSDKGLRQWRRKAYRKGASKPPGADDYPRLAIEAENGHRIKDKPPLIYHADELEEPGFVEHVRRVLERYRDTLAEEKRVLFDRFEYVDAAMKMAGVGSVGTYGGVVLLMAADNDPLFLQIREARRSVLEPFAGPGEFENQGQRVVVGQRLMQAAGDLLLGWSEGDGGRHFYVRQLRDVKLKPNVEMWDAEALAEFAGWCGWVLARAHARSGDAAVIAGYLGQGEPFDRAVTEFAQVYAEQNERDHDALRDAVASGKVEAVTGPAS